MDPLLGRLIDGRYRVDRLVGAGGSGRVYAAHHIALDKAVALKVLSLQPNTSEANRRARVERFEAEGRMLMRMRHPNVVGALDLGVLSGEGIAAPYLVLEWCDGGTLEALIASSGRLAPEHALELLDAVADGMAHAHAAGVVHRDLKPSNVMFAGDAPRVIDFGAATLGERAEGATLHFTPSHAAPEQIAGSRTGPWTDVHAIGLLLYQMVTGTTPYGDEPSRALALERPSAARAGVALGPFEALLARAVALRPEERYPNAGALRDALRALRPVRRAAPGHRDPKRLATGPRSAALLADPTRTEAGTGALAPPVRRRRPMLLLGLGLAPVVLGGAVGAGFWLSAGQPAVEPADARVPKPRAASATASARTPGPRLCALSRPQLHERLEQAGWRVSRSKERELQLELHLIFTDGSPQQLVVLPLAAPLPERGERSGLWRAASVMLFDRRRSYETFYAVAPDCVLILSAAADRRVADAWAALTEGQSYPVRGDTMGGPNPARHALEPVGAGWRATRIRELDAAEFEARVRAAHGTVTGVEPLADGVRVNLAIGGAFAGAITLTTRDADAVLAREQARGRFQYLRDGEALIVVSGAAAFSDSGVFLEKVTWDIAPR